jgi:hypothetical protein
MKFDKRYVVDCREHPESHCSLTIAGTQEEVLDAAVQHVETKHQMKPSPELRQMICQSMKEELAVRT